MNSEGVTCNIYLGLTWDSTCQREGTIHWEVSPTRLPFKQSSGSAICGFMEKEQNFQESARCPWYLHIYMAGSDHYLHSCCTFPLLPSCILFSLFSSYLLLLSGYSFKKPIAYFFFLGWAKVVMWIICVVIFCCFRFYYDQWQTY